MSEARESSSGQAYLPTELGVGRASTAIKLVASACALALAATLLFGLMLLRQHQQDRLNASRRAEQAAHVVAPVQAQVFQDEVRLKGADAVVGGTVKNISDSPLQGLTVEIALKRRAAQETETRTLQIVPNNLQQGEEGQYSLQISPTEYAGAQVVRLHSAARNTDIPFKPELGEKRPLEKNPGGKVIVEPRPRRKGDDFLNTPDTPIRIP